MVIHVYVHDIVIVVVVIVCEYLNLLLVHNTIYYPLNLFIFAVTM